jgi:hypothetical protein
MYPSIMFINYMSEIFYQHSVSSHIIWRRIYNVINNHLQNLTPNDKNAFLEIFNGYINIYMGMEERSNEEEDEDDFALEMEYLSECGLQSEFMAYLILREVEKIKPQITQYELNNLDFIDAETIDEISLIFENKISTTGEFVEEIFEEFYNENIHRGRRMLNSKIRRISQSVA